LKRSVADETAPAEGACNLEVVGIRKEYPGATALDGVTLGFAPGEVHALIGKNGAGKSTLVKILSGAVQPTAGRILVRGERVRLASPRDAFAKGIATVYQELSLVPEMTVGENILLGRMPTTWGGVKLDRRRAYAAASEILASLRMDLDVRAKVSGLGMATQQMVEIAKAMAGEPSAVLMDEPTSALARDETESLFALIARLTARGVTVVYISHRLQELPRVAHRVSVLRDGKLIGTRAIADATPGVIAEMMFGDAMHKTPPAVALARRKPVLEVRGLRRAGRLRDIDLTLHEGEVLGLAGMVGAGRTELLRAISGADRLDGGSIRIDGREVGRPSPARMKALGLGLIPENRKEEGLVLELSTDDNVCLANLKRWARAGVIDRRRRRAAVARTVADLDIAVSDPERKVSELSGGNQQKVVIGKWLNTAPRVLLFDEPTRGIDVRAKQQVFQIIADLSRRGIASIFVSSELEELLDVCHRILVMQEGRITAEVEAADVTLAQLFALCVQADSRSAAS